MAGPRSRAAGRSPAPGRAARSRGLGLGALLILLGGATCGPAAADLASRTHLLELYAGSDRSRLVRHAGSGGYALADGTPISLRGWYQPATPDLTVRMLTEISDGFGISWGFSTGESGAKYRIAPAFHLGFTLRHDLSPQAALSLSGATVFGGRLRESPCTADYGAFGTMAVNCRFAASTLPPEDTLDYLLDVSGRRESWLALRVEYWF